MNTKEAIKFAMKVSDEVVMKSIDDMKDFMFTSPNGQGGCHPLWILGHLVVVEGAIYEILFEKPNPVESWKKFFNGGTEAKDDPALYPSYEEIRSKFYELREETMQLIDSLSDEDFDTLSKNPPKEAEDVFGTFGHTLLFIALHAMSHRGQIADSRRMIGRKPMFG